MTDLGRQHPHVDRGDDGQSAWRGGAKARASVVSRKWLVFCCAKNGSGRGVRREHTRQRSVTDEQRSPEPFLPQPAGPQFFSTSTSLLAPYRPTQVCSSLAPRGSRKSLAAKLQPFARHYTSSGGCLEKEWKVQRGRRRSGCGGTWTGVYPRRYGPVGGRDERSTRPES